MQLLSPTDKAELKLEHGYLYNNKRPVILLVEHNIPPKHSRKWESVNAIKSLFGANKITVSNASLLGANFYVDNVKENLVQKSSIKNWTQLHNHKILSELDQMLIDLQEVTHKELLVVALSTRDLDRGIDHTAFRLKLEWFLQKVDAMGFKRTYIVSFPFNRESFKKYSSVDQEIRLAADSNKAFFIKYSFHKMKHPISEDKWVDIVISQIKKEIEFK